MKSIELLTFRKFNLFFFILIIILLVAYSYNIIAKSLDEDLVNKNKELYWNPNIDEIVKMDIGPNIYYPGYSANKGEKTLKMNFEFKNKNMISSWVNAINNALTWENLAPEFVTANRTFGPKKLTLKFEFHNGSIVAFKLRIIEEFKMVCMFEYFVVKKNNDIEYINRKETRYSQEIYRLLQSQIPNFYDAWVDVNE